MRFEKMAACLLALGIVACEDNEGIENVQPLNDPQISTVLVTSNQNEVQLGTIAAPKATDATVQAFATRMVNEHGVSAMRAQALMTQLGFAPTDSDANRALQADASALGGQLSSATPGAAFDLLYMCNMVRTHANLIQLIDTRLVQAHNPQLLTEVQNERAIAVADFNDAQTIVLTLGKGGMNGTVSSAPFTSNGSITIDAGTVAVCQPFGGTMGTITGNNGGNDDVH